MPGDGSQLCEFWAILRATDSPSGDYGAGGPIGACLGSEPFGDDGLELTVRGYVTVVERTGRNLRELQGNRQEIVVTLDRFLVPVRQTGELVHHAEDADRRRESEHLMNHR